MNEEQFWSSDNDFWNSSGGETSPEEFIPTESTEEESINENNVDDFSYEESRSYNEYFRSPTQEDDDSYVKLELEGYSSFLPARKSQSSHSFTSDIVQKESGGNYSAYNSAGGGEGAVGKYQFRWRIWKPYIDDYVRSRGLSPISKEQFLNSPSIQDGFYEEYYTPKHLLPSVERIKRQYPQYSESELAKLVHFRGEGGAIQYLQGTLGDKPESFNSSISEYTGIQRREYGGVSDEYNPLYNPRMNDIGSGQFVDINFNPPQIPSSVERSPAPEKNNGEKNGAGIINALSLADKIGGVAKTVTDIANERRRGIATGISNTVTGLNQYYASQREGEVRRDALRNIRERPYYSTPSEYNDIPIWT